MTNITKWYEKLQRYFLDESRMFVLITTKKPANDWLCQTYQISVAELCYHKCFIVTKKKFHTPFPLQP